MKSRGSGGRWLAALLCGTMLVASPGRVRPAPDEPPAGFAWEEMKEIHTWILRPAKWCVRSGVWGAPPFKTARSGTEGGPPYEFSSRPFVGFGAFPEGLWLSATPHVRETRGKSAAEHVAEMQKELTNGCEVLGEWKKDGGPSEFYTTYTVTFTGQENGISYTFKSVATVNHVTDTLYYCTLKAPTDRWKDTEPLVDKMLASLRLDPKF